MLKCLKIFAKRSIFFIVLSVPLSSLAQIKSKVEMSEPLFFDHVLENADRDIEPGKASRGPASLDVEEYTTPQETPQTYSQELESLPAAVIDEVLTPQKVRAVSFSVAWATGEVVAFKSSDRQVGVIGYGAIEKIETVGDQTLLYVKLLRQSRHFLIRPGDGIIHLPLLGDNEHYNGSTDLLIQPQAIEVSARYKSLITLGISAGETAQTLWKNEKMITMFGQLFYGVTNRWTLTTVLPGYFVNAPNLGGKTLIYKSESNAVSIGGLATKIPNQESASVNLTFMWDSVSSDTVISHTLLSLAVLTYDRASETTAIKSLGTSSLQNSYEFILSNWDRFIVGPSYNFEKKALGGYASYYMIWDHYHLGLSLNSTNVSSFKLSAEDGYFAAIDSYWRF